MSETKAHKKLIDDLLVYTQIVGWMPQGISRSNWSEVYGLTEFDAHTCKHYVTEATMNRIANHWMLLAMRTLTEQGWKVKPYFRGEKSRLRWTLKRGIPLIHSEHLGEARLYVDHAQQYANAEGRWVSQKLMENS